MLRKVKLISFYNIKSMLCQVPVVVLSAVGRIDYVFDSTVLLDVMLSF